MLTMQEALARLDGYWTGRGCLRVQPMNTEVGAGTLNPATFLRVLGPEPWRVAYPEPSVRPDDSRYGENPNRIQTHTQYQVILKPEPGDPQEQYLGSLEALGIDVRAHDVRFVEDNWASPALGAWGLGWEVWLDGLEITQFTYFQQAGGVNLDPVSVELTYGMERILMALQGVRHFKDIVYADGVTYGELFGPAEYEMSRYYLDDADVAANRSLLDLYTAEAQRMIDERLPVPAYSYVLKCSHTFNVLDARGAVSTAERAAAFARMRRLAADVAQLWITSRAELGHPLGVVTPPPLAAAAAPTTAPGPRQFVLEVGTEEMAPAEAASAREQLDRLVTEGLAGTRLTHGPVTVHATPRRLVAVVDAVADREEDHTRVVRGPRATAPESAVAGFARANGVAVADLERDGEHVVVRRHEPGRPAVEALASALAGTVTGLRSAKNMRWRDPQLSFTRPIRWLLALWGNEIVPLTAGTLGAGRTTRVLRTADQPEVSVRSAEELLDRLAAAGIAVDQDARRAAILAGARELAPGVEADPALVDQITYLVEAPTPLLGRFDPAYLALPEAVLATVMRKHQRYLPVRDGSGALQPCFVAIANGPVDADRVRAGNEAVLRARYEDAAFFHRADLRVPLTTMRDRLATLTFTDRLGSMLARADRIAALAAALPVDLGPDDRQVLDRARGLVKVDLGSQMVTELTSLAGIMAREYARAAGEPEAVATALFEAELPRQAGDALPASLPGALLSLADRLDFLVGLAATVGLPTGSSDPFALRRAALGLIAVHRRHPALADFPLSAGLALAADRQPVAVSGLDEVQQFLAGRLEQVLAEEGHPVDRVRAALVHADRPGRVDAVLAQLDKLVDRPEFHRLAETLQRARRIVPAGTPPAYDPAALREPAEVALHEVLTKVRPSVDLEEFTAATTGLALAVAEFFDEVFVMADDPAVRAARLGLLATVAELGRPVLAWDQLRLP